MTTLREAAQQALKALERYQMMRRDFDRFADEITALRAALAQQEQKPKAWMLTDDSGMRFVSVDRPHPDFVPLYTAPPQRLPLTEEEILSAVGWERAEMYMKLTPNFPVAEAKKETLKNARAIERALKEKNA